MRPEDVLPDDRNEVSLGGLRIRKGSVGAFLANARVLTDPDAAEEARQLAAADMTALVPALAALGLFDVFEARDPRVAEVVARCR